MRKTKRRLEVLVMYDHTGIEKHLEKMARKGWLLERISNMGWIYHRIEPKALHFFVSYYPKASEFDPEPTEGQKTFHDFCAHTGWVLACTSAQMQIFYNEQENPVPIETDPVLEVETIHAAMKKNYLAAQFTLLALSIVMGFLSLLGTFGNIIVALSSPVKVFSGLCWLLVFILSVTDITAYFRWHKKAVEAAEQGIFLDTPSTVAMQWTALVIMGVGGIYLIVNLIASANSMMLFILACMSVYMVLLFALADGIKRLGKRMKLSRNVNRVVSLVMTMILSVIMMNTITFGTLKLNQDGFFDETEDINIEVPLGLEELIEVDQEYIAAQSAEESIFLKRVNVDQFPDFDAENSSVIPNMEYTIVEVKMPFLYERCKAQLVKDLTQAAKLDIPYEYRDRLELSDATAWRAEEAYYVVNENEDWESNHYLLCYEDKLIEIEFSWEVTGEQKNTVGEKLG